VSDFVSWFVLFAIVGSMLALDLLVLNRDAKPVPFRRAAGWSAVWISLALGFGAWVAVSRGTTAGAEYLAGYLIELSLSVDNVFVFALIFTAFAVPPAYQHRLLFWGILGAIVFRAIFIAAGTAVLAAAHWVIYLLGVLLVVTGIRLARSRGHAIEPEKNPVLRLFRRVVPMTNDFEGPRFLVRQGGRLVATPLLAVLVAIETTDIMFALDSIPAVFAITTDSFVIFSSNLFAILGLRALYFLLAGLLDRFVYLKVGLAALLVFAGVKILVSGFYHIPIAVSLLVILLILGTAIVTSLIATHPRRTDLAAPLVRVASGIALGGASLGVIAMAAAWRDGESWPAAAAFVAVVASAAGAVVAGVTFLRRGIAPGLSASLLRIGSGILLATAGLAVVAGAARLREMQAAWLILDALVLVLVAGAAAVGLLQLPRLRARLTWARNWAVASALLLLLAATLVLFD
jgi:tellurite resistance protein TerC